MKKKPGFLLRSVCGAQFLVATGIKNINFSAVIHLNDTSAFLWKAIPEGEEFTIESLTKLLLDEYEVDEDTARQTVQELVSKMKGAGVIEA